MYSEECESNNFKNGLAIGIGLGLSVASLQWFYINVRKRYQPIKS